MNSKYLSAVAVLALSTLTNSWVLSLHSEPEPAQSADGFVDFIGVGTHITTAVGNYSTASYSGVATALGNLGVRHIRADIHQNAYFPQRGNDLYNAYGIRSDMILQRNISEMTLAAQVVAATQNASIEWLEGSNEPNNLTSPYTYTNSAGVYFSDANPAGAGRTYRATLALQDDFDALLNGQKPLLTPAMSNCTLVYQLLPFPTFDIIAIHSYPKGRMSSVHGFVNSAIPSARKMAPVGTMPSIVSTEMGYHTATGQTTDTPHPYVTVEAQAKYLGRGLFEYFNQNIFRSYIYEIIDSGSNMADQEHNFGLIYFNQTPKPSYTAIKNLITLLKEASWNSSQKVWTGLPNFLPGSLDYVMSSASTTIHHTLLQKSNGDFYLALWQEVPSCDIYTDEAAGFPHTNITNATVPVTLTFCTPLSAATVYRPGVSTSSIATYTSQSFTLDVPDEVLLVKLTPKTCPAPWSESDIGTVTTAGSSKFAGGSVDGFRGEYFDNQDFTDRVLFRNDSLINFDWGTGTPGIEIATGSSTIRWTGYVVPQYSETYTFYTRTDDGSRLWVNNSLLINDWVSHAATEMSNSVALTAGQKYPVTMEYFQGGGSTLARLSWSSPSTPKTVIPRAANWAIAGSGTDIGGTTDSFHYVYQPLNGDCEIVARVINLPSTFDAAKAGVMIRQNLTNNSPYATAVVTPTRGLNFQYRPYTGSASVGVTQTGVTVPYWVKLTRTGNAFKAFSSSDGATWTQVGTTQTLTFSNNIYVGLAVCSRTNSAVTGIFDSVYFSQPTVSIQATAPVARENPVTAGAFTVTRTETTSGPLAVAYSISGTALNGTDYTALTGTVTISAGQRTASIPVTPINDSVVEPDKTVRINLATSSAYAIGANCSAAVKIINDDIYDNFENGSLTNWSLNDTVASSISIVAAPANSGSTSNVLKWTYNNATNTRSCVYRTFSTPQDWSKASKLVIRFAEDPANDLAANSRTIHLDLYNNGTSVGTIDYGVDYLDLGMSTKFRTVEFELGKFPRNQVTKIVFFTKGDTYLYGFHTYSWYIDDISLAPQSFYPGSTPGGTSVVVSAPNPTAAYSIATHSTGGTYSIPISVANGTPLTENPPIEPRTGTSKTIVVAFDKTIQSGTATIASGSGTISSTPAFNGNTMTLPLTGVLNAQTLFINLSNIGSTDGAILSNSMVAIRTLIGDINGDGIVNTQDVTSLKAAYGISAGQSTYNHRADLNRDGVITTADVDVIKNYFGTQIP